MPQTPSDRRQVVRRSDYRAPDWLVECIDMSFVLERGATRVSTRLAMRRNPAVDDTGKGIVLNGSGLETRRVVVDGRERSSDEYRIEGENLLLAAQGDEATIETEVIIHPDRNTALEGLYAAGDMLLTQCEAEGFRNITWYPDRPDVMAPYRVRIEADRSAFPVLLSNGNLVDSGTLDDDRHYVVWDDPFPKPSYLFALVAGDLAVSEDEFVTRSGRKVALRIYSEPEDLPRLRWAMTSLKNAMAWDEERFGLEYDLDVYHVVATHDFNMGAMENKSLNVFNSKYVLADPDTATDADFESIESVIGHEYFHNWTGNRVTCRDWFQLTLKEGLTVFRDQEFSADLRSRGVKRIENVAGLMARQFPEDGGPMAHPVRPERYQQINNFYTATVYEKGAEVVRMYQTLLGREGFRKGMDLYFERHDGQAVTCDDFLAAMADANGRGLTQFGRWYRQAGTPRVAIESHFDHATEEWVVRLTQSLPDHPENRDLGALMIPVKIGFLDSDHRPLPVTLSGETEPGPETRLLVLTESETEWRFTGIGENAVPSILRDFSAPVRLDYDRSADELAALAGHDPDPVSRWRAMRQLAENVLDKLIEGDSDAGLAHLAEAWRAVLVDRELDPVLAAELLFVPDEQELAQRRDPVDVEAIHRARREVITHLVDSLITEFEQRRDELSPQGPWSDAQADAARRKLHNRLLELMVIRGIEEAVERAHKLYDAADNMTDRMAGLRALVFGDHAAAATVLDDFARRYADNPLVMDKWFAVQATRPVPGTVETVRALQQHAAFRLTNPNKVGALIGSFAMRNPRAFHRADGAGYRLVAEVIDQLDDLNPQVAARLATAFNRWRAYSREQSALMKTELEQLADKPNLSPDVAEIVNLALGK